MQTAIKNATVVLEDGLLQGKTVLVKDGIITDLVDERSRSGGGPVIDASGCYLLPGFIDSHSDMIETLIQPRPNTTIDFGIALREAEKQLVTQGITTMYHAVSLYTDDTFGDSKVRTLPNVKKLIGLVRDINAGAHLIHHRIHIRYEIENLPALPFVRTLLEKRLVQQLSFTDHTPGQGQYKNLAVYKQAVMGYGKGRMTEARFSELLEHHTAKQVADFTQLQELARIARENGIPVASHDDDCLEKLDINAALGVGISEFPITMEVAREAKKRGFYTVAGAPNVLRGLSHSGNLSARDAIHAHAVDILCSDYYPAALLHAVFKLHREDGMPLWEAARLTTINPANALGIGAQTGSIAPGKQADLVCVGLVDGCPVVRAVLVNGRTAAVLQYGETGGCAG